MASTTSFKQQCPSCEAMVPIRDPALVGRKIDCPKCKYRFVVEKPKGKGDDSSDTPAPSKKVKKTNGSVKADKPAGKGKPAPRRRDEDEEEDEEEDERPRKKKSGVSTTVILGAVLGVVALILMIAGGLYAAGVFGGGSGKDKVTAPSLGNTNPTPTAPGAAPKDGGNDKPKEAGNSVGSEVSNLLPNDSETVVNYQIDKLTGSGLGQAALQTAGGFNENAFKKTFGFPLRDGVVRVLTALGKNKDDNNKPWVFTVLRTTQAVNRDDLITNLQLNESQTKNGLTAYAVRRDLDSLGNLLVKANRKDDDLQVCLLGDNKTLVFADPAPMQKFLDDKGKPTLLSQPTAPPPPPSPGGSGMPNPGGSGMPNPGGSGMPNPAGSGMPNPAGSGAATMPAPAGSGMPNPGGSGMPVPAGSGMPNPGGSGMPVPGGSGSPAAPAAAPRPAAAGAYLSINPDMKAIFDKIEKPDQPALLSIVVLGKDPLVEALIQYSQNRVTSLQISKDVPADSPVFRPMLDKVKDFKPQDASLHLIGFSVNTFKADKAGGVLALDVGNETLAKAYGQALQAFVALVSSPPNPNGGSPTPGGSGMPNPGGSAMPNPSGSGSGVPNPAGSGTATMPNPAGSGSATMPNPGGSGMPNPGGSGMPNPGGSGTPFMPNGGNPSGADQGPLNVLVDKSLVVISATVPLDDAKYQAGEQELAQLMVRLKGAADLASSRSRVHELAAALQMYVKEKGQFPRGTAKRDPTADRFGDWAPDQRLSWMADLLPYLGDGDYKGLKPDAAKSWQEGDNLRVAGLLIPQFLARGGPDNPPRVRYPGAPQEVAVTNFVGVAGVGLDAAEYAPGNPKAGVFGYDRETKSGDVKDGLDKTIVLLEVPGDHKTPWLAGGGATVRGVSEEPDAVKSLACADYEGKHGTFAVMGDGKVRFISEDLDPIVFRGLCTIAGGEKIDNLDKIAPVVPDDAAAAPEAAPPGPPPAPPGPPPTAPPPAPPGK